jgi:hypothetical protein
LFGNFTVRLLLSATPRSGNTWLRYMLADALDLAQIAVHRPTDLPPELPERCIIQMHWRCSPETDAWVERLGLRPLTLTRHPLGVLVSILHFCVFEPDTCQWLDGAGGGETELRGHTTLSPEFLRYAQSTRAAQLLSVTSDWVRAGVPYARYEALVQSPESALLAVLQEIGAEAVKPLDGVVRRHELQALRQTSNNEHFWQGDPNLWKRLLTAEYANAIAETHRQIFADLHYSLEETSFPSAAEVESTWQSLVASRSGRAHAPAVQA